MLLQSKWFQIRHPPTWWKIWTLSKDDTPPDLDLRRVEAHVVDPAAAWVDPAVAQPLPQSLVGDVEADDQVQLVDVVQSLGLGDGPGEPCRRSTGDTRTVTMTIV